MSHVTLAPRVSVPFRLDVEGNEDLPFNMSLQCYAFLLYSSLQHTLPPGLSQPHNHWTDLHGQGKHKNILKCDKVDNEKPFIRFCAFKNTYS